MNDNPLVKEIRKHRAAILASHKGDYRSMMKAMSEKQWQSGHEIVSLAPKTKPVKAGARVTRQKR